jgi:hypothetical protein
MDKKMEQTCTPRWCPTPEDCRPFAQPCTTAADCTSSSCCVILELDNIAVNRPGNMMPEARIAQCERTKVYCDGVCAISNPDWTQFTDAQVIAQLQARVDPRKLESYLMDRYLDTMRQK